MPGSEAKLMSQDIRMGYNETIWVFLQKSSCFLNMPQCLSSTETDTRPSGHQTSLPVYCSLNKYVPDTDCDQYLRDPNLQGSNNSHSKRKQSFAYYLPLTPRGGTSLEMRSCLTEKNRRVISPPVTPISPYSNISHVSDAST